MSIKIHNAFKVKTSPNVWPLLWKIRDYARIRIRKLLAAHYTELVQGMDNGEESLLRLYRARSLVLEGFRKNITRLETDAYSLETAVTVYPHKTGYYLRTFCERASVVCGALRFVAKMPELVDFHYQTSTDRPRSITKKDWDERSRIWEDISNENHDIGNFVVLEILSWGNYHLVDPWLGMVREWSKKPPVLKHG